MTPTPDLAALRALLEQATPRPWQIGENPAARKEVCSIYCTTNEQGYKNIFGEHDLERDYQQMADANAALIVAAVNALPALLDRLERAEGDSRRLDWLESSGRSLHWQYTDGTGSRSESPRFRYAVGEARKVFPWSDHDFAGLLWRPTVREAIDGSIDPALTSTSEQP